MNPSRLMPPALFPSLLTLAFLAGACGQPPDSPTNAPTPTWPINDSDGDNSPDALDCDDEDPDIHPAAIEVCDGVDTNCNGMVDDVSFGTWYIDRDMDGFGSDYEVRSDLEGCNVSGWIWEDDSDCDDKDADTFPGATESCDDHDDDCDREIDEEAVDMDIWYTDADADGYGDPATGVHRCEGGSGLILRGEDCDDTDYDVKPSGQEVCGGGDEDCDGLVDDADDSTSPRPFWYIDLDRDGYGDATTPLQKCLQPSGYVGNLEDCDDQDPTAFPGGTEVCDAADDDCDGSIDESAAGSGYLDSDGDGFGDPDRPSCEGGDSIVGNDGDCDDTDAEVNPGIDEICEDGTDQDCSGADSPCPCLGADVDEDGYSVGESCSVTDCDDDDAAIHPNATELDDDLDNDCDEVVDEGLGRPDSFEPNDTFDTAYDLGSKDNQSVVIIGNVHGPSDLSDFYRIQILDDLPELIGVDPFAVTATLEDVPLDADYNLYLYRGSALSVVSVEGSNADEYVELQGSGGVDDGGTFTIEVRWVRLAEPLAYTLTIDSRG